MEILRKWKISYCKAHCKGSFVINAKTIFKIVLVHKKFRSMFRPLKIGSKFNNWISKLVFERKDLHTVLWIRNRMSNGDKWKQLSQTELKPTRHLNTVKLLRRCKPTNANWFWLGHSYTWTEAVSMVGRACVSFHFTVR